MTSMQRNLSIGAAVVAALAAAGFAWYSSQPPTTQDLVAQIESGEAEDWTDEQRQAARDQIRSAPKEDLAGSERLTRMAEMRDRMQAQMDGYFATPLDEREEYLDGVIDEMLKLREERRQRRAENQEEGREGARRGGEGRRGPGGPGGFGRGDRQAGGNGANGAKRTEYRAAIRKRMEERGISFGRGGQGGGDRGGNNGNGGRTR